MPERPEKSVSMRFFLVVGDNLHIADLERPLDGVLKLIGIEHLIDKPGLLGRRGGKQALIQQRP